MSITLQESLERDDPAKYIYRVQLLEEDKHPTEDPGTLSQEEDSDELNGLDGRREGERVKTERNVNGGGDAKTSWGGSLMEVRCGVISYVDLCYSKTIFSSMA